MIPTSTSTTSKAPPSTASEAPAKPTEGAKAAKKTAKPTPPVEGEKKKRKKLRKEIRKETYVYHIIRVLRQVHPDFSISYMARMVLNSLVNDMFERIATEASKLAAYSKKSTISCREIQTAVRLILPGDLADYVIIEATKAVTSKYLGSPMIPIVSGKCDHCAF